VTRRYPADVVRRVLRHPGSWATRVADRERLPLDTVRGIRMAAGRNAGDGLRPARRPVRTPAATGELDFDELMRTNQSVCP
jgi:hypothetical protein